MKKILTSFLLMAMIAGCVQQGPTEAEKPEEPPVVEQPEKPVEQEKPEEIDKIISITNEPIDIQINLEQYKNQLFIQEPALSWESEDAKKFNDEMSQLAQKCRDELTYREDGYWHTASLLNTQYYINDDILSIVIKLDRLLADAGNGPSEFMTYNFSLTTHNQLSNSEIFSIYEISNNDFQYELDKQLEKDYLPCSTPTGEDGVLEKPCYGDFVGSKGGRFGETSMIYIKDRVIHIFVHVNQAMYQENIDISVYSL